jgi:hypothetical protein
MPSPFMSHPLHRLASLALTSIAIGHAPGPLRTRTAGPQGFGRLDCSTGPASAHNASLMASAYNARPYFRKSLISKLCYRTKDIHTLTQEKSTRGRMPAVSFVRRFISEYRILTVIRVSLCGSELWSLWERNPRHLLSHSFFRIPKIYSGFGRL